MTLRSAGASLALVLLATLPFLGAVRGDFIEDDRPIIRDRVELREPGHVPRLFLETYWPRESPGGLYRPLTMTSYALDRVLWGADETGGPSRFGVHVGNLVLNALASLLVLALLRQRTGSALAAWTGAALFAAHPLHVEAVSHMVGRADLLMTVLFLAAFLVHPRGASGRLAAAILYLLACLAKEMAVVLPGVLLARAALERSDSSTAAFLRRQSLELAPGALALAAFLALRGVVLGAAANPPVAFALYAPPQYLAFQSPAPGEVVLTMTHALGEVLRLLAAPLRLSADYSGFPHATTVTPAVAASAALVAALAAAAFLAARRGARDPAFWLCWLGLTWLPVSNLLFPSGIILAERTLFLPSVTVAGVAAWAVARDRRWLAPALAAAAAFAALSAARAPVWSDSRTLYEATVAHGRYAGHIAKTGLVAELLAELAEKPDPATLSRALALARESLEERPTATSLRQVAALEEASGLVDSAFDRRASLAHFLPTDPENCAALARLLEAQLVRSRGDARRSLELTGSGFVVAQRCESSALVAAWQPRLEGAFQAYIDGALAAGDMEAARRGAESLARTLPGSALLERYRALVTPR